MKEKVRPRHTPRSIYGVVTGNASVINEIYCLVRDLKEMSQGKMIGTPEWRAIGVRHGIKCSNCYQVLVWSGDKDPTLDDWPEECPKCGAKIRDVAKGIEETP
jgi:Zn finger protein HypA/HybF involved in hydrogenase expression